MYIILVCLTVNQRFNTRERVRYDSRYRSTNMILLAASLDYYVVVVPSTAYDGGAVWWSFLVPLPVPTGTNQWYQELNPFTGMSLWPSYPVLRKIVYNKFLNAPTLYCSHYSGVPVYSIKSGKKKKSHKWRCFFWQLLPAAKTSASSKSSGRSTKKSRDTSFETEASAVLLYEYNTS